MGTVPGGRAQGAPFLVLYRPLRAPARPPATTTRVTAAAALTILTALLKAGESPTATPAKIPTHTSKAPISRRGEELEQQLYREKPNRGDAGTVR